MKTWNSGHKTMLWWCIGDRWRTSQCHWVMVGHCATSCITTTHWCCLVTRFGTERFSRVVSVDRVWMMETAERGRRQMWMSCLPMRSSTSSCSMMLWVLLSGCSEIYCDDVAMLSLTYQHLCVTGWNWCVMIFCGASRCRWLVGCRSCWRPVTCLTQFPMRSLSLRTWCTSVLACWVFAMSSMRQQSYSWRGDVTEPVFIMLWVVTFQSENCSGVLFTEYH